MPKATPSPLVIFVYNSVEDEWPVLSHVTDVAQKKKLIIGSNRFSDCYLFVNAQFSEVLYLSPRPIHPLFLKYYATLTKGRVMVKVPKKSSEFICHNIIQDTKLFDWIVKKAKKYNQSVALYSYANTSLLYELKEKLESHNILVSLPLSPEKKDLWTSSYFGSKTGFRKEFSSLMPHGAICTSPKEAAQKASDIYLKNKGVVIKTPYGSAGEGVLIYRKGEFPLDPAQCKKRLLVRFSQDAYWHIHPIIVEQYIDCSLEKKEPFPNIEGVIKQDGTVDLIYCCNMTVTSEGEFYGIDIGQNALSPPLIKQVVKMANTIGKVYSKKGLRGRFDIDFVYDGKKLYANESNVRCTGGTDTYCMVQKLIGDTFFTKRYVIGIYIDLKIKGRKTFKRVMQILKPLLFQKRSQQGVVINSEAVIRHKGLSYIVIASSKSAAMKIDARVKELIRLHS